MKHPPASARGNTPGGTITDLSPLSKLLRLEQVTLRFQQVSDLSPLTTHPALRDIAMSDNQIRSLVGLALPDASPSACSTLDLQADPIQPAELAQVCAQGWFVLWGGAYGIEAGTCGFHGICLAKGN